MSETSSSTELTNKQRAAHAWQEAAGFVPLLERPDAPSLIVDYKGQEHLRVRRGIAGLESLLSRRYFEQTTLELDDSYKERDTHDISWFALKKGLHLDDHHRDAVLEVGTNDMFTPPVETEFINFLAQNTPSAISYALAIDVDGRTLEVAGWNNSNTIDIDRITESVEAFMSGYGLALEHDGASEVTFSAQYVARHALYSRGTVVVATGDQATELTTYEDFSLKRRDRTIEPIDGNVMFARIPFYLGDHQTNDYVPFHAKNSPLPKSLRVAANGSRHPLYSMVHNRYRVEHFLEERDQL